MTQNSYRKHCYQRSEKIDWFFWVPVLVTIKRGSALVPPEPWLSCVGSSLWNPGGLDEGQRDASGPAGRPGGHFTVHQLIELARKHGTSGYVAQGTSRLPAVPVTDAARLFRLAVEHPGASLRRHAVGEQGVAFRAIAQASGRGLGVPVVSLSVLRARWYFKAFAGYAMSDRPASSAIRKRLLGWTPTGAGAARRPGRT